MIHCSFNRHLIRHNSKFFYKKYRIQTTAKTSDHIITFNGYYSFVFFFRKMPTTLLLWLIIFWTTKIISWSNRENILYNVRKVSAFNLFVQIMKMLENIKKKIMNLLHFSISFDKKYKKTSRYNWSITWPTLIITIIMPNNFLYNYYKQNFPMTILDIELVPSSN